MGAFASLLPLAHLLQRLLNSCQVSLLPPSREIIQSAYSQIESLGSRIQNFEWMAGSSRCCEVMAKALDREIREVVCRLEDTLESHLLAQYLCQSEKSLASDPNCPLKFTLDLEEVKQEIIHSIGVVTKIKKDVEDLKLDENSKSSKNDEIKSEDGLDDPSDFEEEEEEEDDEVIEYSDEALQSTSTYQMVGLVDQFLQLKSLLIRSYDHLIIIIGMAGIEKTSLAKQLYDDPIILNHFESRAFVSIGRKYQLKQVIINILSQMGNYFDIARVQNASNDKLVRHLLRTLDKKRCLLVLDDVWNYDLFSELGKINYRRGKSRIVVTSRIAEQDFHGHDFRMRFLNEEESWTLLCEKVFGKDSLCPFELLKVGKKIANNCEGLPLAIVAVANLLVKGDKTLNYWKKVSEDPNPLSIGTPDQDPMLDVLYSSYTELPLYLKPCFLYTGVFPQKTEIIGTKLINLLISEGFITRDMEDIVDYKQSKAMGKKCLEELSSNNIVMITKSGSIYSVKTCKLHSVFWHLCVSEAKKENLFRIISGYSSSSFAEAIKGHRRLCVHNNTLFGIKDAYNSMSAITDVRSLLCTGPHHNYPIPMCFEMRFLKVLDALTIRFYEFPFEVVKLVQLRYLAFTYNGMLHASISQLLNLRFLIIRQHLSMVSPEVPLYLPVEIWNMKELMHLQVTGAHLPHPFIGAILPKLSTILDINAESLTMAVVSCMPNLTKLGIQIDSSAQDPFSFFNNLSHLRHLESLKCIVMNPKPKSQVVSPPNPSKIFPPNLVKLSLSGFGYPWKYMREIRELRRLEVLKLRNYAFHGPEWDADLPNNTNIRVLLLEDLDLMHWRLTPSSLGYLDRLVIRHCYRLQEIRSLDFIRLHSIN